MRVTLPEEAVSESFLAGSGPGGQNVNKVATTVQLRVDVFALGLSPVVWRRLKELAGTRMTARGELIVTAREHRTREANREAARARVLALLEAAHRRPERRIATKPSRAAKARRVDAKKGRSAVKSARARPSVD